MVTFDEAMDFLEAFIVKNDRISDEVKSELFEKKGMLAYDFMGELMGIVYTRMQDGVSNGEINSTNIEHLKIIHEKLDDSDIQRIKSSQNAIGKIEKLKEFLEENENSDEQEDIDAFYTFYNSFV